MRSALSKRFFLLCLLPWGMPGGPVFLEAVEIDLDNHPGKVIYRKMCLDCHGETGRGVPDKADASHNRLCLSIARSMGHNLETFGTGKLCEGGPLNLA